MTKNEEKAAWSDLKTSLTVVADALRAEMVRISAREFSQAIWVVGALTMIRASLASAVRMIELEIRDLDQERPAAGEKPVN